MLFSSKLYRSYYGKSETISMFSHVLTIFLYKKNEGIRLEGIKISKGIIYHKFLYKVLLEN